MILTEPYQSSTADSQATQPQTMLLLVGVGAALGVLLVMVVVIIVVIVIIVVVMRRRHKDLALQQLAEGPAFMCTVGGGPCSPQLWLSVPVFVLELSPKL